MEKVYTLLFRWELEIRIRISSVLDFYIAILYTEIQKAFTPISIYS